jgi:hypothetical protein
MDGMVFISHAIMEIVKILKLKLSDTILKEFLNMKDCPINARTSDSYFYGLNGLQTPSHIALQNKNYKTFHLLKLAGADQSLKDSRGYGITDFNFVKKQQESFDFLQKLKIIEKFEIYRDVSLGCLSEDVYDIHAHIPPSSWKLICHVDHEKESLMLNYYGAAYFDESTGILAILHRGTNLNSNNIQTDVQLFTGILKGEMPTAQYYSCLFSDYISELIFGENPKNVEKLFKTLSNSNQEYVSKHKVSISDVCVKYDELIEKYKKNVKEIIHSGHSLGGAHSQFCSFFDGNKSITFDNPPIRFMIEHMCKLHYNTEESNSFVHRLFTNSKCFFGTPNYINGFSFFGTDKKSLKAFAEMAHISHDVVFVESEEEIELQEKNEENVEKQKEKNVYLEMIKWIAKAAAFGYNQYNSHAIQTINDKISTPSFWKL